MKSVKTIFRTNRLILRDWKTSDIAPFMNLNSDPEVMRFFPNVMTAQQTENFLEKNRVSFSENKYGYYAVEKKATSEFIGFTGFARPSFDSFFTPCVEIGWRFKKEVWGNGFASEAAVGCLTYGFSQLGFTEVYSFTSILNLPSENVMKRLGMKKIGQFNHPKLPASSSLSKHIVYRITKTEWNNFNI